MTLERFWCSEFVPLSRKTLATSALSKLTQAEREALGLNEQAIQEDP